MTLHLLSLVQISFMDHLFQIYLLYILWILFLIIEIKHKVILINLIQTITEKTFYCLMAFLYKPRKFAGYLSSKLQIIFHQ